MTNLFQEPDGATPLEPEERDGLLQSWITHRRDLNEAEQDNIARGAAWGRGQRNRSIDKRLSENFAKSLHKRMFGDVWSWAGKYRRAERNIGIDAGRIPSEIIVMFDDIRYWIAHQTFEPDEIAIRFHNRLVAIHPFPNGNGRHARLMADLLAEALNKPPFSWGGAGLMSAGDLRARYIAALRAADHHDLRPLFAFARS